MAVYTCPMHPEVQQDQPDNCPKCGMTLVPVKTKTGTGNRENMHAGSDHPDHHNHHAHMAADFRKRFWISLVLTLPILVLSPMLQKLAGLREAIRFPGDIYVLFGFSSAVFWYGGWPFLKGLCKELKSRQPGMMTLVAVVITEDDHGIGFI